MEHSEQRKHALAEPPSVETLDAKVNSLETQFHELDSKFTDGFNHINRRLDQQAHDSAATERNILAAMDTKFSRSEEAADRNRPSLMNILLVAAGMGGVVLTVVGGFGSAKLDPIDAALKDHSTHIERLRETTESRDELAARFAIQDLKSDHNGGRIAKLEADYVPRGIILEIQRDYDRQLSDLKGSVKDIEKGTVTRPDIEQMVAAISKRQDLITARVSEVSQQVNALQNKVLVPDNPAPKMTNARPE